MAGTVSALCLKWALYYDVLDIDLPDRAAAMAWIAAHQMDQRNLVGLGRSWMQAVRYDQEKNRPGGIGANQHPAAQPDQTDRAAPATDKRLAKEFHCGPATIRRNAELIKHMAQIVAKGGAEAKGLVLSPDSGCKRADVKWLASLVATALGTFLAELHQGKKFQASWRQHGPSAATRLMVPLEPHALAAVLTQHLSAEDIRIVAQDLDQFLKGQEAAKTLAAGNDCEPVGVGGDGANLLA